MDTHAHVMPAMLEVKCQRALAEQGKDLGDAGLFGHPRVPLELGAASGRGLSKTLDQVWPESDF